MMFEGWANSVLFNKNSHSQGEKDKTFNTWLMLLVRLSKLCRKDRSEWLFDTNFALDGSHVSIHKDLHNYCKA